MAEPDNHAGLFENERETNLESTSAMIEDVLLDLGHFINDCRVEVPRGALRAWRIRKGSAEIGIELVPREDFTHLRSAATILTLDDSVDRVALFTRLLQLNTELAGVAFALVGSQVRLVAERSTRDLDRSEVYALISQLRSRADHFDDALVAEFGGTLGGPA